MAIQSMGFIKIDDVQEREVDPGFAGRSFARIT